MTASRSPLRSRLRTLQLQSKWYFDAMLSYHPRYNWCISPFSIGFCFRVSKLFAFLVTTWRYSVFSMFDPPPSVLVMFHRFLEDCLCIFLAYYCTICCETCSLFHWLFICFFVGSTDDKCG